MWQEARPCLFVDYTGYRSTRNCRGLGITRSEISLDEVDKLQRFEFYDLSYLICVIMKLI